MELVDTTDSSGVSPRWLDNLELVGKLWRSSEDPRTQRLIVIENRWHGVTLGTLVHSMSQQLGIS